jgi:hypothetical protein
VLQYIRSLKDIASAHLFGEILEPIFPIVGGEGEIIRQDFEKHLAFA